jgi:hypothetical protein
LNFFQVSCETVTIRNKLIYVVKKSLCLNATGRKYTYSTPIRSSSSFLQLLHWCARLSVPAQPQRVIDGCCQGLLKHSFPPSCRSVSISQYQQTNLIYRTWLCRKNTSTPGWPSLIPFVSSFFSLPHISRRPCNSPSSLQLSVNTTMILLIINRTLTYGKIRMIHARAMLVANHSRSPLASS